MPAHDDAYHALCAYTLAHGDPRFIHQHVVDTFLAQNADETAKAIGITFALVGLYLYVEHGVSGRDVQRVHMALGKQKQVWPSFVLPERWGALTAADVMTAPPGVERDRRIDKWCASVWMQFRDQRGVIEQLLQQCGLASWFRGRR